mmetsp:Transcript_2912/g.3331  ORF Transcript_2912/g.3331 Transcript_2912/m.3331 type:complete len:110 (+) Transcript_2912:1758-2087(+)
MHCEFRKRSPPGPRNRFFIERGQKFRDSLGSVSLMNRSYYVGVRVFPIQHTVLVVLKPDQNLRKVSAVILPFAYLTISTSTPRDFDFAPASATVLINVKIKPLHLTLSK